MEPRNIEPQDIRVGMRVRGVRDDVVVEGPVSEADRYYVYLGDSERAISVATNGRTWTLLADAPKPQPEPGSHWRDPETGAEYVATDWEPRPFQKYKGAGDTFLSPDWNDDDAIIARLTPIPAFDPATLWPYELDGRQCDADTGRWMCCRAASHEGLHAAYDSGARDAQPVYVWGDPR